MTRFERIVFWIAIALVVFGEVPNIARDLGHYYP